MKIWSWCTEADDARLCEVYTTRELALESIMTELGVSEDELLWEPDNRGDLIGLRCTHMELYLYQINLR